MFAGGWPAGGAATTGTASSAPDGDTRVAEIHPFEIPYTQQICHQSPAAVRPMMGVRAPAVSRPMTG